MGVRRASRATAALAVVTATVLVFAGCDGRADELPAPTPTFTPAAMSVMAAPVRAAESEPPSLIVVSDGSTDSLLLEWTGGPANATKWQYRQRGWENSKPLAWETWTDIPGSGAPTRSYEVTGLLADRGYDYEVRPVMGSTPGRASPLSRSGSTHPQGRLPRLSSDQIVQGDGRTEWQIGGFAFTIPDGMRLRMGLPYTTANGSRGIPVYVHPAEGGLTFSPEGRVLARSVTPRAGATATQDDAAETAMRDVAALLDEIIASLRHLD